MTPFDTPARRSDPYRYFKFRVKWDGRDVAGFAKLSALQRTTEVVEHREGGELQSHHKAPARTKFDAITLERGITHDAGFEQWARAAQGLGAGDGIPLRDLRRDLLIERYDEAGRLASAWKVFRCWVSEFSAVPDLDASASALAIQTLKLEHEGWERVEPVPDASIR